MFDILIKDEMMNVVSFFFYERNHNTYFTAK